MWVAGSIGGGGRPSGSVGKCLLPDPMNQRTVAPSVVAFDKAAAPPGHLFNISVSSIENSENFGAFQRFEINFFFSIFCENLIYQRIQKDNNRFTSSVDGRGMGRIYLFGCEMMACLLPRRRRRRWKEGRLGLAIPCL